MAVFTPVDGRPDRGWIEERLGDWNTMHGVVPHGYEAYVRVFHPIDAQLLDWDGSAHVTLEERVLSWREVADLTGAVAHPLMQWDRISRGLSPYRDGTRGWQYGEPVQGRLPGDLFSRIARVLGDGGGRMCRAALWEGHGWLHPDGTGIAALSSDGAEATHGTAAASIDRSLPFSPAEWDARRLELPHRAYFVFEAALGSLADPTWVEHSGWGWGTSLWGDTPNLVWSLDRSWFLVSEIDFDSTVIGCSAAVAAKLHADPLLEAAIIPEGSSLQDDGDVLNR